VSNPVADWGTILVETDVDAAVIAQLQRWMPTYLTQTERSRNFPAGALARPRDEAYQNALIDETFPDALLPAVVVTTAQTEGEPEPMAVGIDIAYAADWRVVVSVVVRGRTPMETRATAALTGGCVRAILSQQQVELEGLTRWRGCSVVPFSDDNQGRFLAASINRFTIHVDATLTGDGPIEPAPGDPPWPPIDPDNPDQVYDPPPLVSAVRTDIYPWGQAPEPAPTDT
jgi:hypothetical protein